MEIFARIFSACMCASVVWFVVLLGLYASTPAHANTNPCNDGGVASAHMVDATTGASVCFDIPQPREHQSYSAAFVEFYGFHACASEYKLVEDGSCAPFDY